MQEIEAIGSRLRELRVEKDVSLEEMAKVTGLTKSLLSKYERGLTDPGLKALSKLAKYYNVSLDWLFGFTGDRKPLNTDNPMDGLSEGNQLEAIKYIEYLKSKE